MNLAVAIFSKTGGIPWVLADGIEDIDMMVGISMSNRVTAKSRAGTRPRYVGCVNVFDRYGRWMFFEGTARLYNEDKSSRRLQLKELFQNCCTKFEAEKHKMPRNIVVHYYKKFSDFEIKALEEILDDVLKEHSLACVSINSHHPYRVYDKTVSDWSFPRGAYVEFGENRYLLSTTGETPFAGRRMGTPRLLNVNIKHKTDDFVSDEELLEGVFGLTKLNWATSMPMVREPITLTFSESIAYLTAVLSEEEWKGITDAKVNPNLSWRPWFI
jgi:argonaute-like protein implicated in RNA metabolism and viral defense